MGDLPAWAYVLIRLSPAAIAAHLDDEVVVDDHGEIEFVPLSDNERALVLLVLADSPSEAMH